MGRLSVLKSTAKFGLVVAVIVTCLSLGSGIARADSFTATFTCASATCTDTPSVTDNPVTFPSPTLVIDSPGVATGIQWPLMSQDSPTDIYEWSLWTGELTPLAISVTDVTTSDNVYIGFACLSCTTPLEYGYLTFTPTATPEPGTVSLLLSGMLGLGLLAGMRRLL